MDPINKQLIEDIKPIRMPYSRHLFYLWCLLEFRHGEWFHWKDCVSYGIGRRQIMRYLADLEGHGLIERKSASNGKARTTLIKIK